MKKVKDAKKLDYPIDLSDAKCIKDLIANTETGMYATKSNDNEDVVVYITKEECADFHFYQKNGWIREDSYDANGCKESESYIGRYNVEVM